MLKSLIISKSDLLLVLTLLLSPWVIGYTYAAVAPPACQLKTRIPKYFYIDSSWTIRKTISVDIYIFNANDVCAWQAKLVYDPYSLVPLNVIAGDFFSTKTLVVNSSQPLEHIDLNEEEMFDYAILCFATDVADALILGGFRFDMQCVSGGGKVATVTFGVWSHAGDNFNVSVGDVLLLDANLNEAIGTIALVK
ncbi:MAG: hypothetical protein QW279_05610 [Candidatus Jordarchaeaceae archaeon]